MNRAATSLLRLLALLALSALALQLYFIARIALMVLVDPQSSTFQRSEIWRLATTGGPMAWSQRWVDYDRISPQLKRAVVAAEDAGFVEHSGVEWDALEKAWAKNQQAQARAAHMDAPSQRRAARPGAHPTPAAREQPTRPTASSRVRIVGGSTITQQLAKNLFLSGERNLARKAQEIVLAYTLEALLGKQRILEIYLNNVEWGQGIFGAEAAARHYFHIDADALGATQAAQLAVMLPAPKRFEKRPHSAYVVGRATTIRARMGAIELP